MANSLSFAKIVATPSDTAWAQAYNAGSLFAVLSLTKTEDIEPESLPTIGKEILNLLQSEFFALEDKSLPSLKHALHKSFEHTPSSLHVSFAMAFNKDDLLYLLVVGGGKVIMRRNGKIGTLLEYKKDTPNRDIHAASGILQSYDTILLETLDFSEAVSASSLKQALDLELPNDIAETLSPGIHNAEHAASAALILAFHGITPPPAASEKEPPLAEETPKALEPEVPVTDEVKDEKPTEVPAAPEVLEEEEAAEEAAEKKRRFALPSLSLPSRLPKKSLLLIGIVIILLVILISSISLTKKNQEAEKNHALFEQIYNDAKKDYDEGMSLLTLNKSLAHDDFLSAQKTIHQGDGKFKPGSDEQKQLVDLEKKIDEQVGPNAGSTTTSAKEASLSDYPLFATEVKKTDYTAFTENEDAIDAANAKQVISVGKSDQKETTLITNNNDWSSIAAIATYGGNIYLLDKKNSILKYVKTTDYTKSTYFKDTPPDLSKAVAMSIDSSIYILFSDGSIKKYTKGVADTFIVSGLSTPLSSPTHIYTTSDLQNIYVLDPSSARIVKLDKKGVYQSQISATILKNAQDFTIDAKEQQAAILSNGKAYTIPLK